MFVIFCLIYLEKIGHLCHLTVLVVKTGTCIQLMGRLSLNETVHTNSCICYKSVYACEFKFSMNSYQIIGGYTI